MVKVAKEPLSAEQVFRLVKKKCPTVNLTTTYRNLRFLAKQGEIYVTEGTDGTKRFIGHALHHQTFHCQRCGQDEHLALEDFVDAVKYRLRKQPIFYSQLRVVGLCRSCARKIHLTTPNPSFARRGDNQ